MSQFAETRVTRVRAEDDGDDRTATVVITVTRARPSMIISSYTPEAGDVPDDVRDAIADWLGLQLAPPAGPVEVLR